MNETIHWKVIEQYFTVVMFVFQFYPVCNLRKKNIKFWTLLLFYLGIRCVSIVVNALTENDPEVEGFETELDNGFKKEIIIMIYSGLKEFPIPLISLSLELPQVFLSISGSVGIRFFLSLFPTLLVSYVANM